MNTTARIHTHLFCLFTLWLVHFSLAAADFMKPPSSATISETTAKMTFDFEEDTGGWSDAWKSPYMKSIELSEDQAFKGKQSLKVSFDNTTEENQGANIILENPENVEGGETLVVHYWLPADSGIQVLKPSLQSDNYPIVGKDADKLVKGEWGEIEFPLPKDPGHINNIHIQIWLPPNVKGVVYFDSITW